MSLGLLLLVTVVTAVIVIRNKVVALEKTLEERFQQVSKPVNKVVEIANAVREVAKAVK